MAYKDKQKQAKAAHEHYLRNKSKMMARAHENSEVARLRNQIVVIEYLAIHPCVDCAENDIIVLEFDHVRGTKRNAVSILSARGCSIASLKAEIAKCDVRCANCHRRRTHERRNGIVRP